MFEREVIAPSKQVQTVVVLDADALLANLGDPRSSIERAAIMLFSRSLTRSYGAAYSQRSAVDPSPTPACGDRFVVPANRKWRRVWGIVLVMLLFWTGTVLPFKLAFVDFHIPESLDVPAWFAWLERLVDFLFLIDLLVTFFFSYTDLDGNEVMSFKLVVWNYLTGYFIINLIACIPDPLVTEIVKIVTANSDQDRQEGTHELARIGRLNRMSRLPRLVRLVRLVKLITLITKSKFWQSIEGLRGLRIANFVAISVWCTHLMACGMYMTASLHDSAEQTWVYRRVDGEGMSLIEKGAGEQWSHAMYFTLTIFTTVGFGDMSGFTVGEMCYIMVVMVIGLVLNGIIVSEIINVITSLGDDVVQLANRRQLVKAFVRHTYLDDEMADLLQDWVDTTKYSYTSRKDTPEVVELLTRIPHDISETLPLKVYGGELSMNLFLTVCLKQEGRLPSRLSLMIAIYAEESYYSAGELIYQIFDHPVNIFLVIGGTFAAIARPTHSGGISESPLDEHHGTRSVSQRVRCNRLPWIEQVATDVSPYSLVSMRGYFGDVELLLCGPRRCTMRCESPQACTLLLNKGQLRSLADEFPNLASAWTSHARRREWKRVRLLAEHSTCRDYRSLAAHRMQVNLRRILHEARLGQRRSKQHPLLHVGQLRRALQSLPPLAREVFGEPEAGTVDLTAASGAMAKQQRDLQNLRDEVSDLRSTVQSIRELAKESHKAITESLRPTCSATHEPLLRKAYTGGEQGYGEMAMEPGYGVHGALGAAGACC